MASRTIRLPEDDTYVVVQPRRNDDLPTHVRGSAFWVNFQDTDKHAYHAEDTSGASFAIEFLNDDWYQITWKNGQYITSKACKLSRYALGLGWWKPSDPAHPEYRTHIVSPVEAQGATTENESSSGMEEYRSRGDASSASNRGHHISLATDTLATHITQELAAGENGPQTFSVEDAMQQVTYHPMDLTFPDLHIASATATTITHSPQPVQIEHGGGGVGVPSREGPGGPASHGGNGELNGNQPQIFDGRRDKSDDFVQEFTLYRMINQNHYTMAIPYYRILMALSYMKGPKITGWVRARMAELKNQISAGMDRNDEALWARFERCFRDAFTDTTRKEVAALQLTSLQMKGEDLDTYISTFEHLREKVQLERDAQQTFILFLGGLEAGFARAIIGRTHPKPRTVDEWYNAAREQQAIDAEIKAILTDPFTRVDSRYRQWQARGGGRQRQEQGRPRERNPDTMDVDTAQSNLLTDDERKRLQQQGRCFFCKAQGHMSRQCPKKQKGQHINGNTNVPRTQNMIA